MYNRPPDPENNASFGILDNRISALRLEAEPIMNRDRKFSVAIKDFAAKFMSGVVPETFYTDLETLLKSRHITFDEYYTPEKLVYVLYYFLAGLIMDGILDSVEEI